MVFYSPATGGFYLPSVHGDGMPGDVVAISPGRHQRLLAAQSGCREIVANAHGRPVLAPREHPRREQLIAAAIGMIKRDARRRIVAIASLERQANDSALIAGHALAIATADLGGPPEPAEPLAPALERRRRIDALRAASGRLEQRLAGLTVAELATFDPTGADWTEEPTA